MNLKIESLFVVVLLYLQKSQCKLWSSVGTPKSHPTKKELFTKEFVCPTYTWWYNNVNTHRKCSHIHNECNHDDDCRTSGEQRKCCFDGCVKACRRPMTKRIKALRHQEKETVTQKRQICSTSSFLNHKPMQCPVGYVCEIKKKEHKVLPNPNHGYCIENKPKEIDPFKPMVDPVEMDNGCYYNDKKYKHGDHFINLRKCNFCFCSNSIINCQLLRHCKRIKEAKGKHLPSQETSKSSNHISGYR